MIGQTVTFSPLQKSTLRRVEKMTDEEKTDIQKASDAVAKAQAELEAAKARVAAAHKMTRESYMEWSSSYEIDGDFILWRFYSAMSTANY